MLFTNEWRRMSQAIQNVNQHIIQQWLLDNKNVEQIREQLVSKGMSTDSVEEHLKAFKKAKILKRQMNGLIYMGIGAVIGFIGCMLAIIHPSSTLYYTGLYGLTSIAVVFAFIGLYNLFE
jgi:hypothetical protein